MERKTKQLIDQLPAINRIKDITLNITDVPVSYNRDGSVKRYVPGIIYQFNNMSGDPSEGRIVCSSCWFSYTYEKPRIVAAETRSYFETFGVRVNVNDKR
jgi:hypothetical protein